MHELSKRGLCVGERVCLEGCVNSHFYCHTFTFPYRCHHHSPTTAALPSLTTVTFTHSYTSLIFHCYHHSLPGTFDCHPSTHYCHTPLFSLPLSRPLSLHRRQPAQQAPVRHLLPAAEAGGHACVYGQCGGSEETAEG
jgi:hypothetical protein